jgi:hypothetical protein
MTAIEYGLIAGIAVAIITVAGTLGTTPEWNIHDSLNRHHERGVRGRRLPPRSSFARPSALSAGGAFFALALTEPQGAPSRISDAADRRACRASCGAEGPCSLTPSDGCCSRAMAFCRLHNLDRTIQPRRYPRRSFAALSS